MCRHLFFNIYFFSLLKNIPVSRTLFIAFLYSELSSTGTRSDSWWRGDFSQHRNAKLLCPPGQSARRRRLLCSHTTVRKKERNIEKHQRCLLYFFMAIKRGKKPRPNFVNISYHISETCTLTLKKMSKRKKLKSCKIIYGALTCNNLSIQNECGRICYYAITGNAIYEQ